MAKRQYDKIHIEKTGHIVVLDQSWHALFKGKKTPKIAMLEAKLNKLLREQGKVNTDYKAYKILKKQMMEEIVQGMDEAFNKENQETAAKLKTNQGHIKEINKKFERYEKKKSELPEKIESVNQELLSESMYRCYERLVKDKKSKELVEKEIETLREQTQKLVVERDEKEEEIEKLYHFMHDIAGLDVMEQFDQIYFGKDSE